MFCVACWHYYKNCGFGLIKCLKKKMWSENQTSESCPPWLWRESVMVLGIIFHGSVKNPSKYDIGFFCWWQYFALTDTSQIHEEILSEPRRILLRVMMDSSQSHASKKKNLIIQFAMYNTMNLLTNYSLKNFFLHIINCSYFWALSCLLIVLDTCHLHE